MTMKKQWIWGIVGCICLFEVLYLCVIRTHTLTPWVTAFMFDYYLFFFVLLPIIWLLAWCIKAKETKQNKVSVVLLVSMILIFGDGILFLSQPKRVSYVQQGSYIMIERDVWLESAPWLDTYEIDNYFQMHLIDSHKMASGMMQ